MLPHRRRQALSDAHRVSCRWAGEPPRFQEQRPLDDSVNAVELEYAGRSLTDCAPSHDRRSVCAKGEMLGPFISAGVVETDELPSQGRDGSHIRSLVAIAWSASIGQVRHLPRTPVLDADDVIDLTPKVRVPLVNEAVLTDVPRSLCNSGPYSASNMVSGSQGSAAPAPSPTS